MESEEFPLRPCKSLPPPFRDLDALQNRASQHLGNPSSGQSDMGQGVSNPAKEIEGNFKAQEDVMVVQQGNMSVPLKDKGNERAALVRKEGPLQLLDLPLDILKDIFKEVSTCYRPTW